MEAAPPFSNVIVPLKTPRENSVRDVTEKAKALHGAMEKK
jgi:hypothetical protein